jgi:glucose-6-phosphate isomerase
MTQNQTQIRMPTEASSLPGYTHVITGAMESAVGEAGISEAILQQIARRLEAPIARMRSKPSPEEHSVLWLPGRDDDLGQIEATAQTLRQQFKHIVVMGMGGSGLSGLTLAMLKNPAWDLRGSRPSLYFMDNLDPQAMQALLAQIDLRHTGFIVISKSGSTVETLCQMLVILDELKKISEDPGSHFTVITIEGESPILALAEQHGMHFHPHDPHLGGRFFIL